MTIFSTGTKTFAHNPFWTHIDKKLIKSVVALDKNNPVAIEQYFKGRKLQKADSTKENLGFGWTEWDAGFAGGYIAISARFYYYNNEIVSYSITPRLPEEKKLIKRYMKWYGNYFNYSDSAIQVFKFNENAILKPLQDYKGDLNNASANIIQYMTPESGTMYGYRGGYPFYLLQNRQAFLAIKNSLTTKDIELLMYSINPASRLTAIEYYLSNKEKFEKAEVINEWIEKVINETPKTATMFGCSKETIDTRILLLIMSRTVDKYNR